MENIIFTAYSTMFKYETTRSLVMACIYLSKVKHVFFSIESLIVSVQPYDHGVPAIFRWVLGYKDLGSSQGKQQFQSRIKTFCQGKFRLFYLAFRCKIQNKIKFMVENHVISLNGWKINYVLSQYHEFAHTPLRL